jgi:hypothetical protein
MKNILLVGFCLFVAGTCLAQRAQVIFAERGSLMLRIWKQT